LTLEGLEDRTLLSVIPDLPAPLVTGHGTIAGATSGFGDLSTPSIAFDPLSPQKVVSVFVRNDPAHPVTADNHNYAVRVEGRFSTDGGTTWTPFSLPVNLVDPVLTQAGPPVNAFPFAAATDPTVAFDRNHSFYVTYSEHSLDFGQGAIVLQKYDFSNATPTQTIADKALYKWAVHDPAFNPTLAVDANLPTYIDSRTGHLINDPYVNTVYVAWNTNNAAPAGAGATFNPNTIKLLASADGGKDFTGESYVNDGSGNPNLTNAAAPEHDATPRLVVSQGNIAGSVTPGQLSVVWNDFGVQSRIVTAGVHDGGEGFDVAGTSGPIAPAGQTMFTAAVNIPDTRFVLDNLDVTVNMLQAALQEIRIDLVSPDNIDIPLLFNHVNADGSTNASGVSSGDNLGVLNDNAPALTETGTNFDQQAPRSITDANAGAHFVGHFRPEGGSLATFNGFTPQGVPDPAHPGQFKNKLNGQWQLLVTDFRNGTPAQEVLDWTLTFSARLDHTANVTVGTTSVAGAFNGPYPLTPAADPGRGIGPAPDIAADNTIGSFSPYQGRLYVAYVTGATGPTPLGVHGDNTDIVLATSDDGGLTWQSRGRVNNDQAQSDGFSEANTAPTDANGNPQQVTGRPQFNPQVAVDQATGTVLVSFYDARYDAARARVAEFLAASIDGGLTFGNQTFLNKPVQPFDTITQQNVVLGPLPDNQSKGNPGSDLVYGFGDREGLAVHDGQVLAAWAGNENDGSLRILTATTAVAAGPRVLASTEGPVKAETEQTLSGSTVTFNNLFTPDGIQEVNGFVLEFDRFVDPQTVTPANILVTYRDVTTSGSAKGVTVLVTNVTPLFDPDFANLDSNFNTTAAQARFGARRFLISFAPQSGTGTYSYTVLPTVSDRIVNPITQAAGNLMDQNGNGTQGETPSTALGPKPTLGDAYAIPRPVPPMTAFGTGFQPPYDPETLPLIVPGPHVVRTSVPGNSATADNLVVNGNVSSLDVVFDRDMAAPNASDPATFGPQSIVRLIGPAGLINGPFTVTANPNGTDPDPAHPRTFRIGFPTQVLSGTYVLTLSPNIKAKNGDLLDSDLNAGLDMLRGTPQTVDGQPVTTSVTYQPDDLGAPLPIGNLLVAQSVTSSPLTINDNYLIQGLTLQLDISYVNDPDLKATLTAPDGTTTDLLFDFGTGSTTSPANFQSTTFDDSTRTPIRNGTPPFGHHYKPQLPLDVFKGFSSQGTWTLRIEDQAAGTVGSLNAWSLTLQKPVSSTGLGDPVADQASVGFRIFTTDPTNPLSHSVWTAVGPAGIGVNGTSGRIGGLAVDPSDPSGNTVYVGGASGGIWKTTNFLTTDPKGPTYIPLTDFGPTNGLNIGSIAVFGRNNDPNQSIIFAATGDGDTASPGVGFLRSMDGGATWTLLDSTSNFDTGTGLPLPITGTSADGQARDHAFVGSSAYKVIVDPRPTSAGDVIVYAALSGQGTSGGIWRSLDTGATWTLMRGGDATDVVLDPNSGTLDAQGRPTGNLENVYAAFRGEGVFMSPNRGQFFNRLDGGAGESLIQDSDVNGQPPVAVNAPPSTPSSPSGGRILLAKPALTGNPLQDALYAGWLYALVVPGSAANSGGLYLTKDGGQNWTRIALPTLPPVAGEEEAVPTNDTSQPSYNVFNGGGFGGFGNQGETDVSLAIDPNNPNVVYIGGTGNGPPRGFVRVDTTGVSDPYALYLANDRSDAGLLRTATVDPVGAKGQLLSQSISPYGDGYLNLLHNPSDPFNGKTLIPVTGVNDFANTGAGIKWILFDGALAGSSGQHRLVAVSDPLTGHTRLIFGDDQGVFSGVDRGDGTFVQSLGSTTNLGDASGNVVVPFGSRNGNLQITQFFYGAAQPSNLAAQVAVVKGLFYGTTQDNGFPASDVNVLTDGNLVWTNPNGAASHGDGTGVATDPTGSGTLYQYKWPCCGGGTSSFFQVNGSGRTSGLIQGSGADPQWPFASGFNFAVNPINGSQILLSSATGAIFGTANQGTSWVKIGDPTTGALDGQNAPTLAFGAPDPADPTGATNDFLYAGTLGGNIFVTFTGGGSKGDQWTKLSVGLDGSAVRAIITNPNHGSHEAYAVTVKGVYHMVDATAPNAAWQSITGNLFQVMHNIFTPLNDSTQLTEPQPQSLAALLADWRYAIPDNAAAPTGSSHPALYVGGNGGVYRSLDGGHTWTPFPDVADDGASQDGGFLPNAPVTALSWSLGNVDPATGRPIVHGTDAATSQAFFGPDVLLATTDGRGAFAIRVAPVVVPGSVSLDPVLPGPAGSASGPGKSARVLQPVIDGLSEQTAFSNSVKIELFDLTGNPAQPPEIGVNLDANGNPTSTPFATTDPSGRFQIAVKAGYFKGDGSSDGVKVFGIRATDAAGAVGPMTQFTFTLDTAAFIHPDSIHLDANGPLPASQGGSDSGLSLPTLGAQGTYADRVTNVTRPIIDGVLDPAMPTLVNLIDTSLPGSPVVGSSTSDASGNFSIQVAAGVYKSDGSSDGVHNLVVVAPHGAVTSNTVAFSFTLDTQGPVTPAAPALLGSSDSGPSNGDGITNVRTPTYIGTGEPNTQVQLFANGVLVGFDVVNAQGNYSVAVTTPLADGTYAVTVRLSDLAGNLSPSSAAATPPLVVTTTPPTVPSITLDAASNTGPVVSNNFTTAAVPAVLDGSADPGTTEAIVDNGTPIDTFTQGAGGTFLRSEQLSDGVNNIVVQSTDIAGNVATSPILTITIDRQALDPNRKFIRQIYLNELGRAGTPAEWNLWVPALTSGPNGRSAVFNGIARSGEARDRLVKSWYVTYLGRPAGNGEEAPWVAAFSQGAEEEQVLAAFLTTGEYFNHTPALLGISDAPSNQTFVRALFSQLLHRGPNDFELNGFSSASAVLGRQAVAGAILVSAEYRGDVVRGYYLSLLQRPTAPSEQEVDSWVFAPLWDTMIRAGFESSAEFFAHVTGVAP
jgi:subtilisin-like proprotein convertase family protein